MVKKNIYIKQVVKIDIFVLQFIREILSRSENPSL